MSRRVIVNRTAGGETCAEHGGRWCGMEHSDAWDGQPGARARAALAAVEGTAAKPMITGSGVRPDPSRNVVAFWDDPMEGTTAAPTDEFMGIPVVVDESLPPGTIELRAPAVTDEPQELCAAPFVGGVVCGREKGHDGHHQAAKGLGVVAWGIRL